MAQDDPFIWRDMSQSELDAAYDQAIHAPNMEQVVARHAGNSNAVREALGEPLRFAYGSGTNEGIDIYRTGAENAPIHLFIHGGTWQFSDAASNAFPAELFVKAGAHFAVVDFDSVTDHGGDIYALVEQLRQALVWLYTNATSFGGDRSKIYLSGFSSGAHLAGVLLTTHWNEYGLPDDVIKSALLCSGMYDLSPVALSSRRKYLALNQANIPLLSPLMHLDAFSMPVIVAVGTHESPEFQRQARDFVSALVEKGKDVTFLEASEYNHFEIIETLGNPFGILGRAVLAQMQLAFMS
jgi:arylformamidase